jgi:ribonuclease HI
MTRQFWPENYGWQNETPPSDLLIPNAKGTFYNFRASTRVGGGFVPDMIGLYIDGACASNGSPNARAGIGIHFGPNSVHNFSSRLPETSLQTSQCAELYAALVALVQIQHVAGHTFIDNVVLVTDSAYLVDSITDYIFRWKQNGWINSKGEDVANRGLWEKLDLKLIEMRNDGIGVMFWKVARDQNVEADKLAKMAVDRILE